jgi:hypothetical protein
MRVVPLVFLTIMLVACDSDPTAENIQAQAVATADAIENRAEELTRAADNATDAEVNALENQIRALDSSGPAPGDDNGAAAAPTKD